MIDFACKSISKEDIIRCSFNLNKTEYNLLMLLMKENREVSVNYLAKISQLERTTVQKALKSLYKKGLVERYQKNLLNGGYLYSYKIKNKHSLKLEIKKRMREWYQNAIKLIDSL